MLKSSNKIHTLEEAKKRMIRFCSYQERCHKEVEQKLFDLKIVRSNKEKTILYLIEHNFLNEERFAKSFARGKFSIKKWGKQRIIRELKFRKISIYNINIALKEISKEDYVSTFHILAEKKHNQLKGISKLKKKKKLLDYLIYRGWESDLIYKKVNELIT